jgi:hypothetical protein
MSSKDKNFAVSLIAQNFIFTIFTTPFVILSIMDVSVIISNVSSDFGTTVQTVLALGAWFSYVLEATLFFMNLGFNKLFRSELKNLFHRKETSVTRECEQTTIF